MPMHIVAVDSVTIIIKAINGQGLFKQFWPMEIGCVLRTAGSSHASFITSSLKHATNGLKVI